jgi:hypothetical protein
MNTSFIYHPTYSYPVVTVGSRAVTLLSNVPLKVDANQITDGKIFQSTTSPCTNSTISVEFTLTYDIDTICSPVVTLSGLVGKQTPSGKMLVTVYQTVGANPVQEFSTLTGDWDKEAGTLALVLMPTGTLQEPDPYYAYLPDADFATPRWIFKPARIWRLEFGIIHPSREEETSLRYAMKLSLTGACNNVSMTRELTASNMTLENSRFIVKNIGQDNPCPCTKNLVTVTIQTSQTIFLACKPVVTIQGLLGSQTASTSAFLVGSSDGMLQSFGTWNRASGTLIVALARSIVKVENVVFSFELLNQAASQDSPSVNISLGSLIPALPTFIGTVRMDRDGATTPQRYDVIDAQPGDAQPLRIWSVRFVEKTIGQSTPYPGCVNTITATLKFNCPLDPEGCRVQVRISNLIDNSTAFNSSSLVTPPNSFQGANPTGKLSLSGMQHLFLNPTRTESWFAPGLCGDARISANDWCDRNSADCSIGFGFWEEGYVDCVQVNNPRDNMPVIIDPQYDGKNFSVKYNGALTCFEFSSQGHSFPSGGSLTQPGRTGYFSVNRKLNLWLAKRIESNSSHGKCS